jgi:hypothetical protein
MDAESSAKGLVSIELPQFWPVTVEARTCGGTAQSARGRARRPQPPKRPWAGEHAGVRSGLLAETPLGHQSRP